MAPIAMVFGILMSLLGSGLYATAVVRDWNNQDPQATSILIRALTALIPTAFGIVLIFLGWFARDCSDRTRMHLMHGAALLGLLGVVLPLWRVIVAFNSDRAMDPLPVGGNLGFSVLSAIFLGLCVKSFIDARMARTQEEADAQQQPPA